MESLPSGSHPRKEKVAASSTTPDQPKNGNGGPEHDSPPPISSGEMEREIEEVKSLYTIYASEYNTMVKSVESMDVRLANMEKAATWEGLSVVEKALDALTPALNDMNLSCMRYVNAIRDVGRMVEAARQWRKEVTELRKICPNPSERPQKGDD